MDDALRQAVERCITEATGRRARLDGDGRSLGGGCINRARLVETLDGERYFLKSNPQPLPGMFDCEARGLKALAAVDSPLRLPAVLGHGDRESHGCEPFIVLEYIESAPPPAGFSEAFGAAFAQLHQASAGKTPGFDHDNYIGATEQPNRPLEDWVDFWRERRLGYQLRLARERGLADDAMLRAGDAMMRHLEDLIGQPDEPCCLLHGDLWGGNYMADTEGRPVLIDPAAYYGRREADLAMTRLFGGFDARFYHAYHEVWPLAEGHLEREEIYKLYHLLNHLNIFGSSYYSSSMSILRRYA